MRDINNPTPQDIEDLDRIIANLYNQKEDIVNNLQAAIKVRADRAKNFIDKYDKTGRLNQDPSNS